jgi:succinyl-CoA synthetase beta subunit
MNITPIHRALDEFEAKRLLAGYDIPVVGERRAGTVDAAVAAAEALGFPVALKGCDAAYLHKTELGLIRLGLGDAAAVRMAAHDLLAAMDGRGALLVQQMIAGKREFLAGFTRDPQFGPVVTFGIGGIFAEAIGDASLGLCPLAAVDAGAMLDGLRAQALLGPVRGLPPVNRTALIATLLGLSRLALERPDIAAVDINPLIIHGSEPVAVDALVLMR